jgi:enoyl-CoA hydratase/carnithine racemase
VNGSATGIGATWLLHADWVVTSAEATFRFPFIDLGIVPEAASTLLLPHALGLPRAKRLLFGGEKFTGLDAYQWGLIAELVDSAEVISTAWVRAKMLASKDPVIFRKVKDWLHPSNEYHERINEEVLEINSAILQSRKST